MKLTHSVKSNNSSIEEVEAEVNRFEETMNLALKIACPCSYNKKSYPPWWDEKLKNLRVLTRHTFNECYISRQWQPYKDCLKVYKKAIRTAKKEGWRNFCESLNSVKDTARLGRILAEVQSPPSFLKTSAGGWTNSSKESLEELMRAHFPGNSECPSVANTNKESMPFVNTIITKEKVAWAINSFAPYKAAGPDGIFSAMLQECSDVTIP